jgi:nucleoid-associated protein YgaU
MACPVDALDVETKGALQAAADPRVLSAGLLVLLVAAVAFRQPITHAIGTAGEPVPPVRTDIPVLLHSEPYYDFPLENDYVAPPEFNAASDPAPVAVTPQPVALSPSKSAKGAHAGATGGRPTTTYRVRGGDSLWLIAQRQLARNADVNSIDRLTHTLYVANRSKIGPDPSRLSVGITLTLR